MFIKFSFEKGDVYIIERGIDLEINGAERAFQPMDDRPKTPREINKTQRELGKNKVKKYGKSFIIPFFPSDFANESESNEKPFIILLKNDISLS